MRNHRYYGLFGAIIIEPPVIEAPGVEMFREFVVLIQNGIRLLNKEGRLIKTTAVEADEEPDAEDTGEKGYNYRSEWFANRLKKNSGILQQDSRGSGYACI